MGAPAPTAIGTLASAPRSRLPQPPLGVRPTASTLEEAEEAQEAQDRDGSEKEESRGFHDVPVGVPAEVVAGSRVLSTVYQVDEQGQGRVQVSGLEGRV